MLSEKKIILFLTEIISLWQEKVKSKGGKMVKENCDIRAAMARNDLRQYQIAAALGISESRYSSKLRKELSGEEKSKIFAVIEKLSQEAI